MTENFNAEADQEFRLTKKVLEERIAKERDKVAALIIRLKTTYADEVLEELIERIQPFIILYLRSIHEHTRMEKDVRFEYDWTQKFHEVHNKLTWGIIKEIENPHKFFPWLKKVIRREFFSGGPRPRFAPPTIEFDEEDPELEAQSSPNPYIALAFDDVHRCTFGRIRDLAKKLPLPQVATLLLHSYHHLTFTEIAAVFLVDPSTVHNWMWRAREKLKSDRILCELFGDLNEEAAQ